MFDLAGGEGKWKRIADVSRSCVAYLMPSIRESSRNAEEVKVNSVGIRERQLAIIFPRRSENSIRLMENRLYYNPVHSLVHRAIKSIAELKSNHFTKLQPRLLKIHFRHFC